MRYEQLEIINTSSLLGKLGRLVGYTNMPHPVIPMWYVCIFIYDVDSDFVIGSSEGPGDKDKGFIPDCLGGLFHTEGFALFAKRRLSGATFGELRSLIEQGLPKAKFEWAPEVH